MKQILARLSTLHKNAEDCEFTEKAIDSLFKKLKTKAGAIEELERAINNPTVPSKCVTIPRSLDGRLQVSHRKGLPHVIYCRIFRWPDLQTPHELKAIDSCEFSFSSKQNEVCINPYHYERIEIPLLPSILMMQQKQPDQLKPNTGFECYQQHQQQSTQQYSAYNAQQYQYQQQNLSYQCYSPKENYSTTSYQSTTPSTMAGQQTITNSSYASNSSSPSSSTSPTAHYQSTASPQLASTAHTGHYNNYQYYRSNYSSGASFVGFQQSIDITSNDDSTSNQQNFSPINSIHAQQANNAYSDSNTSTFTYDRCMNWCSIVYYEQNMRVGEIFHSSTNNFVVDGFTSPCSNWGRRMCLGIFSNVMRTAAADSCRKLIGRGIHFYNDNGDIYIECLSDSPVYVQSKNCNYEHGLHLATVCKILPGYSMRVFRSKLFVDLVVESLNLGFESVYDLTNMCMARLSFVQGWGPECAYQDISSCPCWIEIRFNEAYQLLDKYLKEFGSSSSTSSSSNSSQNTSTS